MSRFGDIGKQYFDDAGDPLVSGKLYFYVSGSSSVAKDTFADVGLTIENPNPVILTAAGRQPNVFFTGTARVVLTKGNDTQIEVRDPEGDTSTGFGDSWNLSVVYSANDVVRGSDGQYYESKGNGNQGNDPANEGSGAFWNLLFSIEWSVTQTYQTGFNVTGSNGQIYESLTDDNLGNDPISSPNDWRNPASVGWSPVIDYGVGASVRGSDNALYTSAQTPNLDEDPTTSPTFWIPIDLAWSATVDYPVAANAVGSDGAFYQSLQTPNLNQNPVSSPTFWVAGSQDAADSAAAAAVSAAAALVSAGDASTSASDANNSAVAAAGSAVDSAASAVDADNSATDAANSATDAANSLASVSGTSTTTNTIEAGSKTWTTQTGLGFAAGQFVRVSDTIDPVNNFVEGTVTAYVTGTGSITINVEDTSGAGTLSDWVLTTTARTLTLAESIAFNLVF